MRRYVLTFGSTLGLLMVAVAVFCLVVDPYDQQTFLANPNLAPHKYFGDTRTAKALRLHHNSFDAIILGSSRTEIAINPVDTAWSGLRVYNAALAGSNIYETKKVFDHVLKTQNPEMILLGLDFSLFSENRATSSDFALSRFDKHNPISAFFKENLSKPAIEKAIRTLRYNKDGEVESERFGQRLSEDSFQEKIQRVGQYRFLFRTLNTKVITNREAYATGAYSHERFLLFQKMLQQSSDRDIRLILFISPIHAVQMVAIHELGLWPDFQRWKRDLVRALQPHPDVYLYDFSNWNQYQIESIPAFNSDASMRWYWETSHYKQALGHLMLQQMLTDNQAPEAHFGTLLTMENLETELTQQDLARRQYTESHPDEVNHIRCLITRTCTAEQPPVEKQSIP